MKNKKIIPLIFCWMLSFTTWTQIQLPAIFSDHMVLQRQMPIPVWGTADPESTIHVSLAGLEVSVQANQEGHWEVRLPEMPAGGPFQLEVKSEDKQLVTFQDVLIGDVWLCSGQSNMAFPLAKAEGGEQAISKAYHAQFRLFNMKMDAPLGRRPLSETELERLGEGAFFNSSGWQACSPESAGSFSAVAYFFGSALLDSLEVPIGLIHNAVGGSPVQSWISAQALAAHPQLSGFVNFEEGQTWLDLEIIHPWLAQRAALHLSQWIAKGSPAPIPGHPFAPGYLYQYGLLPLAPYAVRGVIWYQGESNATHPDSYPALFELMVKNWRETLEQAGLPFYFVQLPRIGNRSRWPEFREAQQACLSIPNTGMVVAIDQGHPTDVHPKEKEVIGLRLARLALEATYRRPVLGQSPMLSSFEWHQEDHQVLLDFSHTGTQLITTDGNPPKGFLLQGYSDDGQNPVFFQPATIELEKNQIIIGLPEGFLITTLYYAWAPYPENTVTNSIGLPLAPFRVELSGNN